MTALDTRHLPVKIIFTVLILVAVFYLVIFSLLIMALSQTPLWGSVAFFLGFTALLFTLLCAIWNRLFLWRVRFVPFALLVVALLTGLVGFLLQRHDDSIPVHREQSVDLQQYQPFQSDRLAALPGEASLHLEGDLPRLDCATALYPVVAAFVQATYPPGHYSPHNVNEVIFRQTGTAQAYSRLLEGYVDVIFVAGPSQSQLEAARALGVELTLTPIGREAFVFFVNARSPVDGLSLDQIRRIYSGEITDWSQVGGSRGGILAYQRPPDSGSQTALEQLMQGYPLMTPPQDNIVGGMGEIIDRTSSYKNYKSALGFSFLHFATEMVEDSQIRLLTVDGVPPNRDTIASEEYPLTSQFYAVTARDSNPNVPLLLEWILSEEGQYLIQETGYVGIG